jgi:hypothetical protein
VFTTFSKPLVARARNGCSVSLHRANLRRLVAGGRPCFRCVFGVVFHGLVPLKFVCFNCGLWVLYRPSVRPAYVTAVFGRGESRSLLVERDIYIYIYRERERELIVAYLLCFGFEFHEDGSGCSRPVGLFTRCNISCSTFTFCDK